jgi:hypothetical protein
LANILGHYCVGLWELGDQALGTMLHARECHSFDPSFSHVEEHLEQAIHSALNGVRRSTIGFP